MLLVLIFKYIVQIVFFRHLFFKQTNKKKQKKHYIVKNKYKILLKYNIIV